MLRGSFLALLIVLPLASLPGCAVIGDWFDNITGAETEQATQAETLIRLKALEDTYASALQLTMRMTEVGIIEPGTPKAIAIADALRAIHESIQAIRSAYDNGKFGLADDFTEARILIQNLVAILGSL